MFNVKRTEVKKRKEILLCDRCPQQVILSDKKVLTNGTVEPEKQIEVEKARFEIY